MIVRMYVRCPTTITIGQESRYSFFHTVCITKTGQISKVKQNKYSVSRFFVWLNVEPQKNLLVRTYTTQYSQAQDC